MSIKTLVLTNWVYQFTEDLYNGTIVIPHLPKQQTA